MRNEHDANLSLVPLESKPCRPEPIEHYKPRGEWIAVKWCAGVVIGGALLGFVAGVLSAYL